MRVSEFLDKVKIIISTFKVGSYVFTVREPFLESFGDTEISNFEMYNDPDGNIVLEILE